MTSFIVICLGLYFLPTVVAHIRGHHQKVAIMLLNLFLGWSVIGWVAALVWAAMKPQPQQRGAIDPRG
ncbi:superinfection immunity protein [uncultured Sphingomonas sp.]|uniref:superinfection immunity protein n=1 Tax=uncultured Sphingomonas sp. TaxID=158754 RepID=UPI001576D62A